MIFEQNFKGQEGICQVGKEAKCTEGTVTPRGKEHGLSKIIKVQGVRGWVCQQMRMEMCIQAKKLEH